MKLGPSVSSAPSMAEVEGRVRGSKLTDGTRLSMFQPNSRAAFFQGPPGLFFSRDGWREMKIKNSLKALVKRHRDNRVVRRRGRLYVINKTNRRFKARQG